MGKWTQVGSSSNINSLLSHLGKSLLKILELAAAMIGIN